MAKIFILAILTHQKKRTEPIFLALKGWLQAMHVLVKAKRGNKYHAKKASCQHGHTHDSRKEARRCNDLVLLQRAGVIERLEQQPQAWFHLNGVPVVHLNGRRVGYRADFRYFENGQEIWEDAKGVRTEAYVLRAALFRAFHPELILRET